VHDWSQLVHESEQPTYLSEVVGLVMSCQVSGDLNQNGEQPWKQGGDKQDGEIGMQQEQSAMRIDRAAWQENVTVLSACGWHNKM